LLNPSRRPIFLKYRSEIIHWYKMDLLHPIGVIWQLWSIYSDYVGPSYIYFKWGSLHDDSIDRNFLFHVTGDTHAGVLIISQIQKGKLRNQIILNLLQSDKTWNHVRSHDLIYFRKENYLNNIPVAIMLLNLVTFHAIPFVQLASRAACRDRTGIRPEKILRKRKGRLEVYHSSVPKLAS
jgi:hypothetical protein